MRPLRISLAVIGIGLLLIEADLVLGHWHAVVTGREPDWRMWLPVIFTPVAALAALWTAYRPSRTSLSSALYVMAGTTAMGLLGSVFHLLPKLGELGVTALRDEPPIGAPGVFVLLGVLGWLTVESLRRQASQEAAAVEEKEGAEIHRRASRRRAA